MDYITAGTRPGQGNSNLRWRANAQTPNDQMRVTILDDNVPEPAEVIEVIVECDGNENCFIPQRMYTITIVDEQG